MPKYDILQPVPQGAFGSLHEANTRMEKIADVLRREAADSLHDEKLQTGSGTHGGSLWREQRVAEAIAKDGGFWYSIDDVFNLGSIGPVGSENDTYVSLQHHEIYKVNNLTHCGLLSSYLDRLVWHNSIFPETQFEFVGFTGFENRSVFPIVKQAIVDNYPTTIDAIETLMTNLGFKKAEKGHWINDIFDVWDVVPKNVMADVDGLLYVVDAEIRKIGTNL